MNAKKAKALRKLLKNLESTPGSKLSNNAYVENIEARKMIEVNERQPDGTTIQKKIPIAAGTIRNAKDSKRAVYRMLKAEVHKVEDTTKRMSNVSLTQDLNQIEAKTA